MIIFEATTSTFTRPNDTTAYTALDLVANSTTAGSVVPLSLTIPGGSRAVEWLRATVNHSNAVVTLSQFNVHLFKDSPSVTNGDNGAFSATATTYIGNCVTTGVTPLLITTGKATGNFTAGTFSYLDTDSIVYILLEAAAGYTPAAQETFSVTLIGKSYQ